MPGWTGKNLPNVSEVIFFEHQFEYDVISCFLVKGLDRKRHTHTKIYASTHIAIYEVRQ